MTLYTVQCRNYGKKLYISFTGEKVSKGKNIATIYSPNLITAQKELIEAREGKVMKAFKEWYNLLEKKEKEYFSKKKYTFFYSRLRALHGTYSTQNLD